MKSRLFGSFILLAVLLLTACNNRYEVEIYSEDVYETAANEIDCDNPSQYHPAHDLLTHNPTDLIQQIEDGLFDAFTISENSEAIYPTFADIVLSIREAYVWAEADLNGDGTHELIIEAEDSFHPQMRRIISIFVIDFDNQEIKRVFHHNAGLTFFLFLGENGNLVSRFTSYGAYSVRHSYRNAFFSDDWSELYLGEHVSVGYSYEENLVRFFRGQQQINRHEFWDELREITGFHFVDVRPDWYITATTFVSVVRVHEDMPIFYIYRTIVGELPLLTQAGSFDFPQQEVVIRITDEHGNLIQEIDGILQAGDGGWVPSQLFEVRFDDFNFDGYMDMWLIEEVNRGTAGGEWGYFWLWNPETGRFIKNEQLREISQMTWLSVNQDTLQIEIRSRGGGAGPWLTRYHGWIGDEFVAVASELAEWVNRVFVPSYEMTTHRNYLTGEVAREFWPPENAPSLTVTKAVDINPNMEFPTHEVRLDMWRLPEDSAYRIGGYQYEIEITITGFRQDFFGGWRSSQTIRGLRAGYGHGRWIDVDPENPLNLHFEDFNGDGYLDMALRRFPPQTGNMADDPHYFWLFNPEVVSLWDDAFERNHSLEQTASLGQVMSVGGVYVNIFSFHGLQNSNLSQ